MVSEMPCFVNGDEGQASFLCLFKESSLKVNADNDPSFIYLFIILFSLKYSSVNITSFQRFKSILAAYPYRHQLENLTLDVNFLQKWLYKHGDSGLSSGNPVEFINNNKLDAFDIALACLCDIAPLSDIVYISELNNIFNYIADELN